MRSIRLWSIVAAIAVLSGCNAMPVRDIASCDRTFSALGEQGKQVLDAAVIVASPDEPFASNPFVSAAVKWGSGIAVGPHAVLLSAHQVKKLTKVLVLSRDGRRIKGFVEMRDDALDYAVVRTEETIAHYIPIRSTAVAEGESVYLVSYPGTRELLACPGEIASIKRKLDGQPEDFLNYNAYSEPGSSGGALVDSRGNLIGIHVRSYVASKEPVKSMGARCIKYPCRDQLVSGPATLPPAAKSFARSIALVCGRYDCDRLRREE